MVHQSPHELLALFPCHQLTCAGSQIWIHLAIQNHFLFSQKAPKKLPVTSRPNSNSAKGTYTKQPTLPIFPLLFVQSISPVL